MMRTHNDLTRTQYLGIFLQKSLTRVGLSRQHFARNLGLELATVDALLNGAIPVGHISDDLLTAIALQVHLDPQALRLALGWARLESFDEAELETAPADSRETQEALRHNGANYHNGNPLRLSDVRLTLESFVAEANQIEQPASRRCLQPVIHMLQSFIEMK